MQMALKEKPATPFRVPPGIKLIRVGASSGMRAGPGESAGVILEAYKPGTAPPDSFTVIGGDATAGISSEGDRTVGAGTGGLY
jgi:penicillin-binding protein 1A